MKVGTKKKRIIKSIQETLEISSAHGIPKIFLSPNWTIRVIWTFFTIVSTGFCVYLIIRNIINYYDYEVTTKIRVNYEYELKFPSVTVCNYNLFTNESSINILESNESIPEYVYLIQKAMRLGKIKEYSDSLNKLITFFGFDSIAMNVSNETFTYFLHPMYGNCYTFNNDKYDNGSMKNPLITKNIGSLRNLEIHFNFTAYKKSDLLSRNTYYGGLLFVHEFGSLPFTEDPIFLPTNFLTTIALQRTLTIQLPVPYSSCELDESQSVKINSILYQDLKNKSIKYTQNLCFKYCFFKYILDECSCYYDDYFTFQEYLPCFYEKELECAKSKVIYLKESNYFDDFCQPNCPLECEKITYTKTQSFIYNSEFENDINQKIAKVSVYFENFFITEITESEVIDTVTLISNIGGIAGLFLGVSLLSFIEIIAIVVKVVKIKLKK